MTMTEQELKKYLEYEIIGSWWTQYLYFDWMQKLSAKYYTGKVLRKLHRVEEYKERRKKALEYLTKTDSK